MSTGAGKGTETSLFRQYKMSTGAGKGTKTMAPRPTYLEMPPHTGIFLLRYIVFYHTVAPAKNAGAWRRKKRPPPLFCASGRPDTQKNNS